MATLKINNTTFTFNNIYYIDTLIGLDTNPGAEDSPYKTLSKALAACATTGDAVYLKGATTENVVISGKTISIFGNYLTQGSKIIGRIGSPSNSYNLNLNIYGIFLQQNLDAGAWAEMFYNMGTVKFYNCIMDDIAGYSEVYGTKYSHYNCLILRSGLLGYSNSGYLFQNCAFVTSPVVVNGVSLSNTYFLTNVTYDDKYNITCGGWKNSGTGLNPDGTMANIGVHGGPYSISISQCNITLSYPFDDNDISKLLHVVGSISTTAPFQYNYKVIDNNNNIILPESLVTNAVNNSTFSFDLDLNSLPDGVNYLNLIITPTVGGVVISSINPILVYKSNGRYLSAIKMFNTKPITLSKETTNMFPVCIFTGNIKIYLINTIDNSIAELTPNIFNTIQSTKSFKLRFSLSADAEVKSYSFLHL